MSTTDPGPGAQERTIGQLVASATNDISTLVRGEIALAKVEVSAQLKKAGIGGALLAAAGVIAFYAVYFVFITIAEALTALGLPRWLSFLIVTLLMLAMAAVLALLGIRKMKTVKPKPEKAIAEAQTTIETLKTAAQSPSPSTMRITIPDPRARRRTDAHDRLPAAKERPLGELDDTQRLPGSYRDA